MGSYAPEYYGGESEETPVETLSDPIEAAAADPLSTTIDGVTVTNRSISDKIAADRHAAANRASSNNAFGIGLRRVRPGSAVRE